MYMKIKLSTGYEYDLSQSSEVNNLRKNISTMKSREQFDRLAKLYDQLKPYEGYQGKNQAKINAANLCHLLAPMLSHLQPTPIAIPKVTISTITKPTQKTVAAQVPQEIKVAARAEHTVLARKIVYGRADKAPITISYRNDQGKTRRHSQVDRAYRTPGETTANNAP